MPRHEHEFRGVWRCEHPEAPADLPWTTITGTPHWYPCSRGRFVYTCACGAEGYAL